jgi:hypothetical protein
MPRVARSLHTARSARASLHAPRRERPLHRRRAHRGGASAPPRASSVGADSAIARAGGCAAVAMTTQPRPRLRRGRDDNAAARVNVVCHPGWPPRVPRSSMARAHSRLTLLSGLLAALPAPPLPLVLPALPCPASLVVLPARLQPARSGFGGAAAAAPPPRLRRSGWRGRQCRARRRRFTVDAAARQTERRREAAETRAGRPLPAPLQPLLSLARYPLRRSRRLSAAQMTDAKIYTCCKRLDIEGEYITPAVCCPARSK